MPNVPRHRPAKPQPSISESLNNTLFPSVFPCKREVGTHEPSSNANNNSTFPTIYESRGFPTGELLLLLRRRENQHKICPYQTLFLIHVFDLNVGDWAFGYFRALDFFFTRPKLLMKNCFVSFFSYQCGHGFRVCGLRRSFGRGSLARFRIALLLSRILPTSWNKVLSRRGILEYRSANALIAISHCIKFLYLSAPGIL